MFLIYERIECCRYSILVDNDEAAFTVDTIVDFKRFVVWLLLNVALETSCWQQRQRV